MLMRETTMLKPRLGTLLALAVLARSLACGGKPGATTSPAPAPEAPAAQAESMPAPYTYPPPVTGHLTEVNTGDFDLVDGIAYPAKSGAGTVVYVTSKAIASPILAESPCPMTLARALTAIRDAGYVEVTLDEKGKSKYFGKGTAFGGTGRESDVGGRYWSSRLNLADGRASGKVEHKQHGGFEFDLPLSSPKITEISESDKMDGKRSDPLGVTPTEAQVTAAYETLREAASKKDLKALLAAQGFDEKQIAAIRGLDGIDADFAVYADRFLEPGTTGEFQNGPGHGAIVGTGTNSKGAKYLNFYWFTPCLDKLVLVTISENPQ